MSAYLTVPASGCPMKIGKKVVAVVVCRPGLSADQLGEAIKERCKTALATFKRPREIIFVKQEEMPRTPTGKILHRKLREMCGCGKLPLAV